MSSCLPLQWISDAKKYYILPGELDEPLLDQEQPDSPISLQNPEEDLNDSVFAWLQNPQRDPLKTPQMFRHLFQEDDCLTKSFPHIPKEVLLSLSDFFFRQRNDAKTLRLLKLAHIYRSSLLQETFPKIGSILHKAAYSGSLESVRFLINQEIIAVNQTNEQGITALHFAAFRGYESIVRLLLSRGADPNRRDKTEHANTPFLAALTSPFPNLETLKALYPKNKCFLTNKDGIPLLLHVAAAMNLPYLEILQRLLDDGLDPLQPNSNGVTPLLLAIAKKAFLCIELFSQKVAATDPSRLVEYYDEADEEVKAVMKRFISRES